MNVDPVQQAFLELDVPWQTKALPKDVHTAIETASAMGCGLDQIVKSLIFKDRTTGEPVLVLVSGSKRLDERHFAEQTGVGLRRASPSFVQERTGFAVGSVPPTGHKDEVRVFVDAALTKQAEVWAGTGVPDRLCCLEGSKLAEVANGRVFEIA